MSLGRDSLVNGIGALVPLVVALPAVGVLARVLDTERFALVMLAWALVGFAGVLDLGLSRAVVHAIAADRADPESQRRTMGSAIATVLALAAFGALLLMLLRTPLVNDWLTVSPALREDARDGFTLVAFTLPLLLPTLMVHGYWDGLQSFIESNLQRALAGSLVPVCCAIGAAIEPSFTSAMLGLLVARAIALTVALSRHGFWRQVRPLQTSRDRLKRLLHFGGWATVSNLVGPLLGTLDRYVLAATRGAGVVGFYAAPVDAAAKLMVLPVAVTRSLFPKLIEHPAQSGPLIRHSLGLIAVVCLPVAAIGALLAPWILELWLGPVYAERSTTTLRVLMLGFLLSAFAQVPFTALQARGRADLPALLHLLEVGPFIAAAWWLTSAHGVDGAAWAWTLRNGVDAIGLTALTRVGRDA